MYTSGEVYDNDNLFKDDGEWYLSYHPERAVGDSEMECTASWSAAGGYIVALTVSEDSVLQGVLDLQGAIKVILPTAPAVSNEGQSSPLLALAPPFLGPGFRLGARWNRLVETVKTRKNREKTGGKWARYGLKRVKEGS